MSEKDRGKNFKKLKNKTIATKETWRKQTIQRAQENSFQEEQVLYLGIKNRMLYKRNLQGTKMVSYKLNI